LFPLQTKAEDYIPEDSGEESQVEEEGEEEAEE
jgi:hypothetical protein